MQGQVEGRIENSKESLIIIVIFLTYFIQPWHFANRDPNNSTAVLRHHDGDGVRLFSAVVPHPEQGNLPAA